MTDKSVEAFVEAILDDEPPKQFRASPDDVDLLRVALELRSSQAEFARPDPLFVEELHRRLAMTAAEDEELIPLLPGGSQASQKVPRRFVLIGKAAAAAALVAATFTATNLVGGHSPAPVAQKSTASTVRSGVLLTADGRPLGYTYAYSGNPSWIFMDVKGSSLTGTYTCELHLADGATVPAGLVVVYNGTGDWAHTVRVQADQVRQATLVTAAGVTVASATLS